MSSFLSFMHGLPFTCFQVKLCSVNILLFEIMNTHSTEMYNLNMLFYFSATDKEAAKIEQWKRQVILQNSFQRHTLSIPPDQ